MMITHPVSVANANASLQLPMGSSKRAECRTTQDLILRWVYPFHEENRALLELCQTTGFANAYGPKTIRVVWNAIILQHAYNRHPFCLLLKPKDHDGLCQHSESLWASRPPLHNWLTSMWTHAWDDDCSIQSMPLVCRIYGLKLRQTYQCNGS